MPCFLQQVLDKGYKVILSSPWYLNYISYGESWKNYYKADPIASLPGSEPLKLKNMSSYE